MSKATNDDYYDIRPGEYIPSEEKIKKECEKLRKKWSEDKAYKRMTGLDKQPYEIPITYFSEEK